VEYEQIFSRTSGTLYTYLEEQGLHSLRSLHPCLNSFAPPGLCAYCYINPYMYAIVLLPRQGEYTFVAGYPGRNEELRIKNEE